MRSDASESQDVTSPSSSGPTPAGLLRRRLLLAAMVIGLITHGFNVFHYPLYLTDEGDYVQRAWSVVNHGALSPYTYTYDHAPFGWLTLAAWMAVLPGHFHTFGDPINAGRLLMVFLHVASVFLLFEVTRRLSGNKPWVAFFATLLFNLSPLGVIYQRMVLLDNFMVFWVLLSLYLLLKSDQRVMTVLAAGASLGFAMASKETAIFFLPAFVYILRLRTNGSVNRRFAKGFFALAVSFPIGYYILYAFLKSELMPAGWSFALDGQPGDHVSLLYEIWWQLHRSQGSALAPSSFLRVSWLPKDRFLLIGGAIATAVLLYRGLTDRRRNQAELAAGLLVVGYAFYLLRGSVLLDFYVVPMVPMLSLAIALVLGRWAERLPVRGRVIAAGALVLALLSPAGGYLMVHGTRGQLQLADMYRLHLTDMQIAQLNWVEANVPKNAKLIIDDDMWVSLHDAGYKYAYSHYEASGDPAVRDKVFHQSWQNIDYIVMSNRMRQAMVLNGGENWILDALDNHSQQVWQIQRGGIELSVQRVAGSGGTQTNS